MSNGRAKKGGEMGMNGEFYKGGAFLPSTHLPKRSAQKQQPQPKKTLLPWQIEQIKRAIDGTKKIIEQARCEGRHNAVQANEAYLQTLIKQLTNTL